MARTIADIQAQIVSTVQADSTLGPLLTSASATAIWRLWTYVAASAIYLVESLWDNFKVEVAELVANGKPHTLRWYQQKALAYQHGATLVAGEDYYDNSSLTPDQVAAQQIIKQAAATEGSDGSLIVKVAKLSAGELIQPNLGEVAAISAYFREVKDAGVKLSVRGAAADRLKVTVDVYYDATLLSSAGARLDGTAVTPVQDAAKSFLKSLPFDGEFVKAHLVDALQKVEGVVVPEIRLCQARRNDDPSFANVDVFYQPFSGFLKFYDPADLTLNFIST